MAIRQLIDSGAPASALIDLVIHKFSLPKEATFLDPQALSTYQAFVKALRVRARKSVLGTPLSPSTEFKVYPPLPFLVPLLPVTSFFFTSQEILSQLEGLCTSTASCTVGPASIITRDSLPQRSGLSVEIETTIFDAANKLYKSWVVSCYGERSQEADVPLDTSSTIPAWIVPDALDVEERCLKNQTLLTPEALKTRQPQDTSRSLDLSQVLQGPHSIESFQTFLESYKKVMSSGISQDDRYLRKKVPLAPIFVAGLPDEASIDWLRFSAENAADVSVPVFFLATTENVEKVIARITKEKVPFPPSFPPSLLSSLFFYSHSPPPPLLCTYTQGRPPNVHWSVVLLSQEEIPAFVSKVLKMWMFWLVPCQEPMFWERLTMAGVQRRCTPARALAVSEAPMKELSESSIKAFLAEGKKSRNEILDALRNLESCDELFDSIPISYNGDYEMQRCYDVLRGLSLSLDTHASLCKAMAPYATVSHLELSPHKIRPFSKPSEVHFSKLSDCDLGGPIEKPILFNVPVQIEWRGARFEGLEDPAMVMDRISCT